jgi:hypothetical protein
METIFKKGDRVFCIISGWGIIVEINEGEYPISVEFNNVHYTYSEDGRVNQYAPPTLSFSEYTLEGFTQERPEELPKKGDIVWTRAEFPGEWQIGHFYKKEGNEYRTYISPSLKGWNNKGTEITTKNPYSNEQ